MEHKHKIEENIRLGKLIDTVNGRGWHKYRETLIRALRKCKDCVELERTINDICEIQIKDQANLYLEILKIKYGTQRIR